MTNIKNLTLQENTQRFFVLLTAFFMSPFLAYRYSKIVGCRWYRVGMHTKGYHGRTWWQTIKDVNDGWMFGNDD